MTIEQLEQRLEYRFQDPNRLREALCHRSWVNEHPEGKLRDNERLEFLGDAVLGLIIGHLLMRRHPDHREGDLSRARAALVNERQLAQVAGRLGLGPHLLLGRGEARTDGRSKPSILADALEAVLAAVYLDGGFAAAFRVVKTHFAEPIDAASPAGPLADCKSRLQEMLQLDRRSAPHYEVIETSGPDHDKTYRIRLTAGGLETTGSGRNKKAAQQEAARRALERLEAGRPDRP